MKIFYRSMCPTTLAAISIRVNEHRWGSIFMKQAGSDKVARVAVCAASPHKVIKYLFIDFIHLGKSPRSHTIHILTNPCSNWRVGQFTWFKPTRVFTHKVVIGYLGFIVDSIFNRLLNNLWFNVVSEPCPKGRPVFRMLRTVIGNKRSGIFICA